MSLRAERGKGVAIQFLKKLYILWITSDFSNPRNDEEFLNIKENIFCNAKKKIENNYRLEYNNGSVLHENLSPVNRLKPEIFPFGLYSNYTIFKKFVNTLIHLIF